MLIANVIKTALESGSSDIHIQEDDYCCIRINGELIKLDDIAESGDLVEFCDAYAGYEDEPDKNGDRVFRRDFAFTLHDRRFRGNYYKAQKKMCLALRALSTKIPSLKQLHMPPEMEMLKQVGKGLILIIGETGSGKSTTMASLIQHFNENHPYNILTIEDPVEYVYVPVKSRISQREVGDDVESFAQGVKDAMREDPDIIVLGEMRDMETVQNAITLAETGHMVFATLHARNCIEVMDRIADVFPGDSKDTARAQTANVLQAVVHQTLIRSEQYGRLPLLEIMRVDQAIRTSLANKKLEVENIRQKIRTSRKEGSLHRVDSFKWLMEEWDADPDIAERVLSPDDFNLLMGGK